jgi:hypothetical protein
VLEQHIQVRRVAFASDREEQVRFPPAESLIDEARWLQLERPPIEPRGQLSGQHGTQFRAGMLRLR